MYWVCNSFIGNLNLPERNSCWNTEFMTKYFRLFSQLWSNGKNLKFTSSIVKDVPKSGIGRSNDDFIDILYIYIYNIYRISFL